MRAYITRCTHNTTTTLGGLFYLFEINTRTNVAGGNEFVLCFRRCTQTGSLLNEMERGGLDVVVGIFTRQVVRQAASRQGRECIFV